MSAAKEAKTSKTSVKVEQAGHVSSVTATSPDAPETGTADKGAAEGNPGAKEEAGD